MPEEISGLPLGSLLKAVLRERSLSMRKLSELTAIDTATISRIANGKQPANAKHLQRIAHALNFPVVQLFSAAGFEVGNLRQEIASDIHTVVDEVLKSSNLFSEQGLPIGSSRNSSDMSNMLKPRKGNGLSGRASLPK